MPMNDTPEVGHVTLRSTVDLQAFRDSLRRVCEQLDDELDILAEIE